MPMERKETKLGLMIKSLLNERSLSMRKLGETSGLDVSTISRIINGKQRPKPEQLQMMAKCLAVPTEMLFEAAGFFEIKNEENKSYQASETLKNIHEVLGTTNLLDSESAISQIKKELSNYEQYAQTEEGKRIILDEFQKKIEQTGGIGPFIIDLKRIYEQFINTSDMMPERSILGSALLYFILSTDIIPDYLFPVGYLDDAIAVQVVLNRLSQMNNTQDET